MDVSKEQHACAHNYTAGLRLRLTEFNHRHHLKVSKEAPRNRSRCVSRSTSFVRRRVRRTSYSIASHISIFLLSGLSNYRHFQLPQTVSIFRRDVAHFAKILPLKVIFLFAHLLKLFKLPSLTCLSNFPSVPVQPANSVILRPIVSKPIPRDSAYPI